MPATIPTKTAGSLGEALADTRTPVANELSAVHLERLKSLAIEIATEIGATGAPASGSILDRLDALASSYNWRDVVGSIVAVGGDIAIGASDGVLVVDTTSVRTLTLPDPATVTGKLPFLVIDASNGAAGKPISLVRFGAELIDGVASTKALAKDGGRWWVWTNGANWYTAECAPAVTDHGALTGRSDDDHPQYVLADGTRAITGTLSVEELNIGGPATVGGEDILTGATGAPIAHVGAGGAAHAEATTSAPGFMSAEDKDLQLERAHATALYEDFWNGVTATVFINDSSGAGAAGGTGISSSQNHPGVARIAAGTTTTGRGGIRTAQNLPTGGGEVAVEWVVQVEALSTAVEEFAVLVGLPNALSSLTPTGVYFTYQRGTSLNWLANTNDGSPTQSDTGVPVSTGWVRLGIRVNVGATSVGFYIDGTLVATIATTVPTTSALALGAAITKSAGTTSRNLNVDYAAYRKSFSTPR